MLPVVCECFTLVNRHVRVERDKNTASMKNIAVYLLFGYLFVYLSVDPMIIGALERSPAVGSWGDVNSPDLTNTPV